MARYFLRYRHSDTGLTPTFNFFKKASDLTTQATPPIGEVGSGTYYFDYSPTFDIVFEVDGGASIPTEEVRYISDTISPKDVYIDEPTSQVKDDVWNDAVNRSVGTKGDFVEHIGIDTDAVDAATVFGKVYKARDAVMGGTGFGGTGVDVKTTYDRVGAPLGGFSNLADQLGDPSGANSIAQDIAAVKSVVDTINTETDPAAIADAVWDAATTGNVTGGTMGGLLDAAKTAIDAVNIETDAASIANAVWDAATTGNVTGGTMGGLVNDAATGSGGAPGAVASAVWDAALSGHTAPGTFGQTLQLNDSGACAGGGPSSVTLRPGASGSNEFYKNGLITITAGSGVGQSRSITSYDGTTKVATVDRPWATEPAGDGSEYTILPAAPSSSLTNAGIAGAVWDEAIASHLGVGSTGEKLNSGGVSAATLAAAVWDESLATHATAGSFGSTLQLLTYGQATAAGGSTITLAGGSSGIDDFYKNALLVITAGPGVGQARSITSYVGLTKVATVDRAWGVPVTAASDYMVIPAANTPIDSAVIAGAVWDVALASHLSVGTTGEALQTGTAPYVKFEANGDTVLPVILQVASPKHTQVRITFSEPVVMDTSPIGALNVSNYVIPGLTIVSVTALTSQQVMLTTSAQTPNFLYNLSVNNVQDTQGNTIA